MGHGRRPNPRLIKIHRTYTVDEAARVLGTHKNSVRNWKKHGLTPIDGKRPILFHGEELVRFLTERRAKAKTPCPRGHIYCIRCRAPKMPAGKMADYLPLTPTLGNLRGICPDCELLIHRRVSLAGLHAVRADLDIAFPEAAPRIGEIPSTSVNCDPKREGKCR